MPNRTSVPFAFASQERSEFLTQQLVPGASVVATLAQRPRAQFTEPEHIPLGSGRFRYQWGLGIGLDDCNLLYVMHRGPDGDFSQAALELRLKTNLGLSCSSQCENNGYEPNVPVLYRGGELGVIWIRRSVDGSTLDIFGYDMTGEIKLGCYPNYPVPTHWNGQCKIKFRGDNCLALGVLTY